MFPDALIIGWLFSPDGRAANGHCRYFTGRNLCLVILMDRTARLSPFRIVATMISRHDFLPPLSP